MHVKARCNKSITYIMSCVKFCSYSNILKYDIAFKVDVYAKNLASVVRVWNCGHLRSQIIT